MTLTKVKTGVFPKHKEVVFMLDYDILDSLGKLLLMLADC